MINEKLKECPCGKTPEYINVYDAGQGGKYANAVPDCCGEWMIEFRTDYKDLQSEECNELAISAWNSANRSNEKLKALLTGLAVENPDYWMNRTPKELDDLGRCISNNMAKLDSQLLIDALITVTDRLRIMQDNGRAKMLDNIAVDQADFALASVGVMKNV